MAKKALELVELGPELEGSYRLYLQSIRAEAKTLVPWVLNLPSKDFGAFLARLGEMSKGIQTSSIGVANTTYCLVDRDGGIVGISNLRHELTATLEHQDGHIGYSIRPDLRGRGYGTKLLAMTLQKAKAVGIQLALVTCETQNVASARVIEKNGGCFEDRRISKSTGKPVARYWIEL